ncbi:BQ5605_C015g07943 [Microbotryum silenes-dioicae]|uniref:BQ5605_C015g07943 protein n=1 Tax=Microbotryum silenes-dioicae TaxID=796604 RepID=A0A2X0LTN9_9BASI|nr:BQ5605_C015g07943 [Microbotryum silenes-dioicae]
MTGRRAGAHQIDGREDLHIVILFLFFFKRCKAESRLFVHSRCFRICRRLGLDLVLEDREPVPLGRLGLTKCRYTHHCLVVKHRRLCRYRIVFIRRRRSVLVSGEGHLVILGLFSVHVLIYTLVRARFVLVCLCEPRSLLPTILLVDHLLNDPLRLDLDINPNFLILSLRVPFEHLQGQILDSILGSASIVLVLDLFALVVLLIKVTAVDFLVVIFPLLPLIITRQLAAFLHPSLLHHLPLILDPPDRLLILLSARTVIHLLQRLHQLGQPLKGHVREILGLEIDERVQVVVFLVVVVLPVIEPAEAGD